MKRIETEFAPIVRPLLFLLHDESFVVAVIAFLAILICKNIPALAGEQQTIEGILLLLVSLLIGRYTIGNVATTVAGGPKTSEEAIRAMLLALATDFSAGSVNPQKDNHSLNGDAVEGKPGTP